MLLPVHSALTTLLLLPFSTLARPNPNLAPEAFNPFHRPSIIPRGPLPLPSPVAETDPDAYNPVHINLGPGLVEPRAPIPEADPFNRFHPVPIATTNKHDETFEAHERDLRDVADQGEEIGVLTAVPTWGEFAVETVGVSDSVDVAGETLLMADTDPTGTTITAAAPTGGSGSSNTLDGNTVPVIGPSTYDPSYAPGSATIPSTAIVTPSATSTPGTTSGAHTNFSARSALNIGVIATLLSVAFGAWSASV